LGGSRHSWMTRQSEEEGHRESLPHAAVESYRAEYTEMGKARDTGKVSTEARSPTRQRISAMADRSSMSEPPGGPELSMPHHLRLMHRRRDTGQVLSTCGLENSYD
jgi:hypothetical protein